MKWRGRAKVASIGCSMSRVPLPFVRGNQAASGHLLFLDGGGNGGDIFLGMGLAWRYLRGRSGLRMGWLGTVSTFRCAGWANFIWTTEEIVFLRLIECVVFPRVSRWCSASHFEGISTHNHPASPFFSPVSPMQSVAARGRVADVQPCASDMELNMPRTTPYVNALWCLSAILEVPQLRLRHDPVPRTRPALLAGVPGTSCLARLPQVSAIPLPLPPLACPVPRSRFPAPGGSTSFNSLSLPPPLQPISIASASLLQTPTPPSISPRDFHSDSVSFNHRCGFFPIEPDLFWRIVYRRANDRDI